MIISHITGGLGNQLFQYALGRCLAHRHNTELKLDISFYEENKSSYVNKYRLNNFNIQENFATADEIKKFPALNETQTIFIPEVMDSPDNIFLNGFWQTEKYFIEIEDIIKREFTLKNPLGKNSAAWKEKILSSTCAVSLHVRHGDYMTYESRHIRGLLSVSFYKTCINTLRKDFSDITIFVFSDDLQWCKENFKFDVPTEFVEDCEYAYEEIYLMSLCKHNIISNGTFAWWGAWLNQNPDKKVLAPYPWHRCGWGGETIISESWIKIPVDYSAWLPMLSIIFYVDDITQINLSLMSVFVQYFKDYEIILIDASADGSGKFYRQFARDERVTFLRSDADKGKFFAWNKALDVARGDFVLFLTSKNFIFPYTANILSNVCDNFFKQNSSTSQNYQFYAEFDKHTPNIVCSTQNLDEDEGGTIGINGIPNKKFSLKVDTAFKNLSSVAELSIPSNQKLIALGTQNIRNNIGTKFFKRKFLIDNNISFREGGGMDAELSFVVDAFLATEKITFVSQAFLGQFK